MKLLLVTPKATPELSSDRAIAERVLEELLAATSLPRSVLVRRIGYVQPKQLVAVVEQLVATGDITEGTGGILAAAPVRLVDRGAGRGFWLGTTPQRWLARRVPELVLQEGWPRRVAISDVSREACQALGGVCIPLLQWARRPGVPQAAWLIELRVRLSLQPQVQGALIPAHWQPQQLRPDGHWHSGRVEQETALIRWKEAGYFRIALASLDRLLPLTSDEGRRTLLALLQEYRVPARFSIEAGVDTSRIRLSHYLPAAEWRFLVGLSDSVVRERQKVEAILPSSELSGLIKVLAEAGLEEG
jgi:hypothetical protein